jgi:hypothetical protein
MTAPVPNSWRSRPFVRLFALLLACTAFGAVPAAAVAQSLVQTPQTKEEAEKAAEAAAAEASSSDSGTSDSTILYALIGTGVVLIAGASWWMVRDASDTVGEERRAAPGRPLPGDAVGRGAPKNIFAGDGEPGGKVGKQKRRVQGKRQRQARKANRPR